MKCKCPIDGCKEVKEFHSYSIRSGGLFDNRGHLIECPVHKKPMIAEEIPGEFNCSVMAFSISSSDQKKSILKKRSDEHFKKEIAEIKREKIKKNEQ